METLVPAFIAALLTQLGEKPAQLAAILADRYGRPLLVALMAGLALAGLNALAAVFAIAIAPTLTPNAQQLFLAVALLVGGLGAFFPARTPDRLESWGIGPVFTPLLGIFSLALGSQTQFFTLAFAVQGTPWFAFVGAAAGAFTVLFVASVLGEALWSRIPMRAFRAVMGIAFLIAAAVIGAGALRLA